jgi:hypothetical protein
MSDLLWSLAARHADPPTAAWLEESRPNRGTPLSAVGFRAAFAGAGRRLRASALRLSAEEEQRLRAVGILSPRDWGVDGLARAALLREALEACRPERHVALVREVYMKGDEREQAAVLRALSLLPGPARFLEIGIDGCRTNVRDVFEAIACENPYPAEHFPDPAFNQLVLKAYFVGVAASRIVGLDRRRTPELRRMAADYASERRAAGRPVPADIHLAMQQGDA